MVITFIFAQTKITKRERCQNVHVALKGLNNIA